MRVFIIGIAGGVGRRIARQLLAGGNEINGLVRRPAYQEELARNGVSTTLGDLVSMSIPELAVALHGSDAIVFTAGAGGRDGPEATTRVDGEGPVKLASAAKIADVRRFILVSVFPEAWRERDMPKDFEHYMVEKKNAESLTECRLAGFVGSDSLGLRITWESKCLGPKPTASCIRPERRTTQPI